MIDVHTPRKITQTQRERECVKLEENERRVEWRRKERQREREKERVGEKG